MSVDRAEIAVFAEGFLGIPIDVHAEVDLLGASGCEGDDAFEFMEAFSERFGVDLTGYRWEFHHSDEAAQLNPGWPFKAPHQKVERIPLTLALLTEAAAKGVWPLGYPDVDLGTGRPDIWNGLILFAGIVLVGGFAIWLGTVIM